MTKIKSKRREGRKTTVFDVFVYEAGHRAGKEEGKRKVVRDFIKLCGKLPTKLGFPRHLLLVDIHEYAKKQGITITPLPQKKGRVNKK
jgi:hypothetical protein